MEINLFDDSNLGLLLEFEGYSDDQLEQAYQTIRDKILEVVELVFSKILEAELPTTISVELLPNTEEEVEEKGFVRLAGFNSETSDDDNLYFDVHEKIVRYILDGTDDGEWVNTIVHEMIHAADQPNLDAGDVLVDKIRKDLMYHDNVETGPANVALFNVLRVLMRYRAEGVAILGSHLLMRRPFGDSGQTLSTFPVVFGTMTRLSEAMLQQQQVINGGSVSESIRNYAYVVSPYLLLRVMDKLGAVDHDLVEKAFRGLDGGPYELTEEEIVSIIRTTLRISFPDYVDGFLRLGDDIGPIGPFLALCARLRNDYDQDNVDAFTRLLKEPGSKEVFNAAMDRIMGSCMPEADIDAAFSAYHNGSPSFSDHTGLAEKVGRLYSVMKSDGNRERRLIAKWALTYFFDDMDMIHDDILGLGYVDDTAVVEYALGLLEPRS